ncbi:hypothetical protein KIN20_008204 [Parelaphostrongylus tenuis]|uniref:Uncharacterized protein n=1 Tax=Parelaphostrongylus tenuis TaxID=148309 RepID=A0AAD5QIN7_PARTN|nr:hypothetical protein KIN20_008204 [Parelaphostrongylus tenuis]
MAGDMAEELKKKNVCVVSIWPGAARTEFVTNLTTSESAEEKKKMLSEMFGQGETPEYPGKAVVALASDVRRMEKTGRILITEDLGREYGFQDIDGRDPPNCRSVTFLLWHGGYHQLSHWVPSWVKIPGWFLWATSSRL